MDQVLEHFAEGERSELELECRLKHKDGNYRWVHARFMSVGKSHETRRILVTHLDVTERNLRTEELRHSAHHDALTSLPNRAMIYSYIQELLAKTARTGGEFGLLFVDLDRFKPINDRYGHAMGDLVLKTVSERLAASVRADDFVGRLAGDEFIIVLPDLSSREAAASVAQHTLNIMGQPFQIDGYELHVSPSIGISVYPCDGETVDALLHSADAAMYDAKQRGRNRYSFSEFTQHSSMNSVLNGK